jgi:hypothetical protein
MQSGTAVFRSKVRVGAQIRPSRSAVSTAVGSPAASVRPADTATTCSRASTLARPAEGLRMATVKLAMRAREELGDGR